MPPSPIPEPLLNQLPWFGKKTQLPRYRYVPGIFPHPNRDPKGHSFQLERPPALPFWIPDEWKTLEEYLYGIDLFNRFYFWEAHEEWERLWSIYPPEAEPAQFIQGLIILAACFLKLHMGEASATGKLWIAASIHFGPFSAKRWMGIDVTLLLEEVNRFLIPLKNGALPQLGPETPRIWLQ